MIFGCSLILACSSKPSSFYVLNSKPFSGQHSKYKGWKIGIRKLQIPEYLKRPQLVYRLSSNQVHLDEFQRWAEPLQKNIVRVIQGDIIALMPGALVKVYPWSYLYKPQFEIFMTISDFGTTSLFISQLTVHYEIYERGKLRATRNLKLSCKIVNHTITAVVSSMNENLHQLSKSIVKNLKRL